MAPKRQIEADEPDSVAKKPRQGFKVGPDNLPDGPWRRKVTKIKKELIHKAKIKKEYAKIKAREQQQAAPKKPAPESHEEPADKEASPADKTEASPEENPAEAIHPTRQLMIADEDKAEANAEPSEQHHPGGDGQRRRTRRPGYYDNQLKKAEQREAEAEARREEFERRQAERERRLAERERFKKAMAKTRGKDGKKKLGRESAILLDKVKRMVSEN